MYTAKALLSFALLLSVSGCATSQGGSRLPQQAPNLVASPNTLNFGNKAVGSTSTLTVTLTNSGNVTATVSQISVTGGAGFSTSLTPPLALTAGQSSTFTVRCSP